MEKETEENKDIYTNSDDQQAISYGYTHHDYLWIEQHQQSTENKVEPTESLQEVYNNDKFNGVAISGSYVYFDSPFMFSRGFSDKLEAVSDLQEKPVDYIGEVAVDQIDPALEIEDEKEVYTEEDWKRYF